MGGYNMDWQFRESLKQAESFSESRHSAKSNDNTDTKEKIYSSVTKDNLKDTANQFAKYLKENFNEIRQARSISSEMAQSFLDYKANNCNQNTIYRYKSDLEKLHTCIVDRWCNKNDNLMQQWETKMPIAFEGFKTAMLREDKTRDIWMDNDKLQEIKAHIKENSTKDTLYNALCIEEILGLRVGELADLRANDIQFISEDKAIITIQMHDDTKKDEGPKGGRTRVFEIEGQENIQVLREIINDKVGDEKILGVSKSALHKAWERLPESITGEFKSANSSYHAIRKMVGTEIYNTAYTKALEEYKEKGLNEQDSSLRAEKDALSKLNIFLGHGESRDLRREYVKK
ncbi:hypothetical protein IAI10_23045 [Clostridium sp. 19966]|uniref:hypothetical protein n=1 Tax=Clostridium sp. 19966 TaxID=2768166 RepID=UPI0028DDCDCE|nr:hypothetical protein [Clostridium sp. 19966]MDT8719526.1 hypothetical protein [Clostridium sp. 19966]